MKDEDLQIPLCSDNKGRSHLSYSKGAGDDILRTGTVWTAVAHIITAVIGAGVLSLAWSISQLGWVAGPAAMLLFAVVTYFTSCLLADFYRSPDPITGSRNCTYRDVIGATLGERQEWLCALCQYVNLYGTCVAYTITAAISIRTIWRSTCLLKEGNSSPCQFSEYSFMILFGVAEIIFSQIPDFAKTRWLSTVAAIMSFSYATIGLGLGFARVIENGRIYGSIGGISGSRTISEAQKFWQIFQALGDIAFSYSYTIVLIEIQDTLKSPPPENQTMKKASLLAIITTTIFYMLCGCFGYAAFGENTPGDLLTGFGSNQHSWLVDFANACIAVHLVGAYQVYCQPLFAVVERSLSQKWPNNRFVNYNCGMDMRWFGSYNLNLFRLCWRAAFVVSTTSIAILFPSFNNALSILGAVTFWPLIVYFPVKMYIVQNKVQRWTSKWIPLQTLSFICFLVSVAAAVGSIAGLFNAKQSQKQ